MPRPATLDPSSAAQLASALDVALAKKRARADSVENGTWAATFNDGLILLALKLRRWWRRLPQDRRREELLAYAYKTWWRANEMAGTAPAPRTKAELAIATEELRRIAWQCHCIAKLAQRLDRRDTDAAAGIVHKVRKPDRPIRVAVVRDPGVPAAPGKPSKKLSRTELHEQQQQAIKEQHEAVMAARQAAAPPPSPQPQDLGWFKGVVNEFHQREHVGSVAIPALGLTAACITPRVFFDAAIVNLFPQQRVECYIIRNVDGSTVVRSIKMAGGHPSSEPDRVQLIKRLH
jgi:hypothetical protein